MASKTSTTTGNIVSVERAGTSPMGNPTWRINLEDGRSFLTQVNGSVGYSATNFRPPYGHGPLPVILTLTKAGRVQDITYTDGTR